MTAVIVLSAVLLVLVALLARGARRMANSIRVAYRELPPDPRPERAARAARLTEPTDPR